MHGSFKVNYQKLSLDLLCHLFWLMRKIYLNEAIFEIPIYVHAVFNVFCHLKGQVPSFYVIYSNGAVFDVIMLTIIIFTWKVIFGLLLKGYLPIMLVFNSLRQIHCQLELQFQVTLPCRKVASFFSKVTSKSLQPQLWRKNNFMVVFTSGHSVSQMMPSRPDMSALNCWRTS